MTGEQQGLTGPARALGMFRFTNPALQASLATVLHGGALILRRCSHAALTQHASHSRCCHPDTGARTRTRCVCSGSTGLPDHRSGQGSSLHLGLQSQLSVLELTESIRLIKADIYSFTVDSLLALGAHYRAPVAGIYIDPLWSSRHEFAPSLRLTSCTAAWEVGRSTAVCSTSLHTALELWRHPFAILHRIGERFLFWRSP